MWGTFLFDAKLPAGSARGNGRFDLRAPSDSEAAAVGPKPDVGHRRFSAPSVGLFGLRGAASCAAKAALHRRCLHLSSRVPTRLINPVVHETHEFGERREGLAGRESLTLNPFQAEGQARGAANVMAGDRNRSPPPSLEADTSTVSVSAPSLTVGQGKSRCHWDFPPKKEADIARHQ